MKDFFDRKTFNPANNPEHQRILSTLRGQGSHRLVVARGGHRRDGAQSTAMKWVVASGARSGTFLDLGCGNSGDALVAMKLGFDAHGLDLFPPSYDIKVPFIQCDVVDRIPFDDDSVDVAISQAMLDLIEPVARDQFFREVNRVLKPAGSFFCMMQWLQSGWGFDREEERDRARRVWPDLSTRSTGFVSVKGGS